MKKKNLLYIFIVVIIISLITYGIIRGKSLPGEYDEFAKCLTEKDVKMYGTDWCHFCQAQKKEFGKSFKYINYINCDFNKADCDSAKVKGYPTWTINNQTYPGVQPLEYLSTLSKCEL